MMMMMIMLLGMARVRGITQFYLPPTRTIHEWNKPSCFTL